MTERNRTLDKLEKLMALQERWRNPMTERNRTLPAKSRKELKELAFQKSWTLEVLSREIGISYKTLHQGLGGVILAERTLFKIQQFIDKQADVA